MVLLSHYSKSCDGVETQVCWLRHVLRRVNPSCLAVIAALENKHLSERYEFNELSDAASLLRPHLQALNTAFPPKEWASLRERL
jgi:hypothetical protein